MTDYNPIDPTVIYLDVRRPLPFPDESIDYYYSEHLIAERSYTEGCHMLQEMFRTLRGGGRVRIAILDLQAVLSLYAPHKPDSIEARYIEWSQSTMRLKAPRVRAAFAINNLINHRFVYDAPTLTDALEAAGFSDIVRCSVGNSDNQTARSRAAW